MDATNIDDKHSEIQKSSKRGRNSSTKKRTATQEESIKWLVDKGWTKEKDLSANKVFLCRQIIVEGRLHATDKLCVCGKVIVTGKLECEGNFTLRGTVQCWNKPATVNNMIITRTGAIDGDVMVKAGVYIHGTCTVNGTLTVTGNLKIRGTLRCTSLNLTGNLEKIGQGSKLIVDRDSVINGVDPAFDRLASLLLAYEASSQMHAQHGSDEDVDPTSTQVATLL
ncbi:hypothetical protein F4824DRAFT_494357 [Ustulina deusta]|nr:hypothetical protein F4823DRAFT_564289 [Ustulina deusta]KAI3344104.1 hypothetical protein F4824DRAFT_494357 [Ustulina deusta]